MRQFTRAGTSGVLLAALTLHRRDLEAGGVAPDAQYWLSAARAIGEVGMGARDSDAVTILREAIGWLPSLGGCAAEAAGVGARLSC